MWLMEMPGPFEANLMESSCPGLGSLSQAQPVLGSLFKGRFVGGIDRLSKRVDGCAFVDVEALGFSAPFFVFPVIQEG